jgi:hypothetical protein
VRAGVFERKALNALLESHLAGHEDHGNRLWLLINTEVWYRMTILGETARAAA